LPKIFGPGRTSGKKKKKKRLAEGVQKERGGKEGLEQKLNISSWFEFAEEEVGGHRQVTRGRKVESKLNL